MKAKNERYEFSFDEQINAGGSEKLEGFVFDVCPKGCDPMTDKKPCIVLMSEDKGNDKKGNEIGHSPFGYIEFADMSNLELAQMGLEIFQQAIFRDSEVKEELEKAKKK